MAHLRKLLTYSIQDLNIFTRDIQVFIDRIGRWDRTITITTKPSATVESLCHEIEGRTGSVVGSMRLIYGGKALEKGRMLYEYGISGNETLHIVFRLLGG